MTILANSDNEGASSSGNNDLTRAIAMHHPDSESPFHLQHGSPNRFLEISIEIHGNQVGQHLRVGLRAERYPGVFKSSS